MEGVRINYLGMDYVKIAMLHYWEAEQAYKGLSELEYRGRESGIYEDAIHLNTIITITFSAMALESFLNNYAASMLGDQFYYENLNSLNPIGKLQLIFRFILHAELDKTSDLYRLVRTLFKTRNTFVHNKSTDGSELGMTEEECAQLDAFLETEEGKAFLDQSERVKLEQPWSAVTSALDALRAVKEVADFFEQHAPEACAAMCLLMHGGFLSDSKTDIAHIRAVQRALGVSVLAQ